LVPAELAATSVRATDDIAAIGPIDVVLLTVKMYDLEAAAASLAPLLADHIVVVTLQNGVEAVDIVARHVGREADVATPIHSFISAVLKPQVQGGET
jgi:2-dehydropantoate 2-reductase